MNKNQIVGRSMAFFAAIFYGVNTTLSRLSYDVGTTPVSLTMYRFLMAGVMMVLIVFVLRKSWKMSVSPGIFSLCVLGLYITSIGHLGAVRYIPVSISAIIFYTFPLQIIAWKRLVNRQTLTRYELIGFILAFAGLAVALGPTFQQLDPVGLALAFSGSIGSVLFILSYEKFPRGTDSYVGSMWITLGTIILCIISLQFGFELTPPRENAGWFYMVAIAGCSVIAFVLSLRAIKKVGAAVFALFLNIEPVVILLLAWIVIGEDLTLARISGIVMVVMALIISHWRNPAGSQKSF